jgi:predicted GIY-YIG superfamily endonuclease
VKPSGKAWFVYLLRCANGTLYTGIAKDVSRRCQQHKAGTASRYTRSRLPVELVYQEAHASRGSALRREAAIKALPRRQKESIILLAVCDDDGNLRPLPSPVPITRKQKRHDPAAVRDVRLGRLGFLAM